MKKIYGILLLHFLLGSVYGQDNGFPFGKVTYNDLNMKVYERDTTAPAVVLNEFGEAYIDEGGNFNLLFKYHAKIKILKKSGLSYADIEIPLWKQNGKIEILRSVKASAFNIENGSMRETTLNDRDVFTENRGKFYDVKKFAIPNVREGSVIEFTYVM